MATPLEEVYKSFLYKVKDYNFIRLNESGDLENVLYNYLRGAIVRFDNCDKSLEINDDVKSFEEDLTFEEIEILSTIMVLMYVNGKIIDVKNTSLIMSEPDFKMYSQANHLDKMILLSKKIDSDVSELKNIYSLRKGLDDLAWWVNMEKLTKK